jgi:signal transduction histidine kinase
VRERSLWLRKRKPRSPYLLDGFIGVGVGAVVLIAFVLVERTPEFPLEADVPGVLLVCAAWGSLVWRRRAPVTVLVVSAVTSTFAYVVGYPDTGVGFAALIALYTVASRCERWVTMTAVVLAVVSQAVAVTLVDVEAPVAQLIGGIAMIGVCAAWGDRKQVREAYVEQLELRAAEKERERFEAAQRAVSAERARIARELHDVVAHAMSVVAVQSGVGAHVIDTHPAEAKRILETISDTSRDALDEMRRMLGVLRQDAEEPDDFSPAPGLGAVGELVERVKRAGVPVDLRVEGERAPLPAGVDLAAYRIVQEALTNVIKHAGPAEAIVVVQYDDDAVRLAILDDGRGAASGQPDVDVGSSSGLDGSGDVAVGAGVAPSPAAGGRRGVNGASPVAAVPAATRPPGGPGGGRHRRPGHGIVGMRERAELYGGKLVAGPRPGGGFRVTATLHHDARVGAT